MTIFCDVRYVVFFFIDNDNIYFSAKRKANARHKHSSIFIDYNALRTNQPPLSLPRSSLKPKGTP